MTVEKELRKFWAALTRRPNRLTQLANRYGSDKGDRRYERHQYTRIYEPLFQARRQDNLRLLEIGLLNSRAYGAWSRRDQRYEGSAAGARAPSLEMWAEYFPRAAIFGFDINDFSTVHLPRCQIVRGDMGSRDDLARLVATTGGRFDIIIDDASHASQHQQIALGYLFPHVTPGGLYIVEDLRWQPAAIERAGVTKTVEVLRSAAVTGAFSSTLLLPAEKAALEAEVASVELYDSLVADQALTSNDSIAVLRKR